MSLVAYGSSSESEDSDHETPVQQSKRSLSSMLPKPKKTVYVDLPKVDDDEEEVERQPKRTKISAGLGLADLLPAPKNTRNSAPVLATTTTRAFVPHSLSKKMKGKEKATNDSVEPPQDEEEDEDKPEEEEKEDKTKPVEHVGSFFRIGKELRSEVAPKPSPKPTISLRTEYTVEREPPKEEEPQMTAVDIYAYDPNAMYSTDPSVYYQYQQEQEAYYNHLQETQQFEDITGIRGDANIQIKTVNQNDMLLSDEDRANRALTQAPKFETGVPMQASKLQMKKNNIMALAAHAVNNQEKLDEMFAANKRTRRDAAKKYGF